MSSEAERDRRWPSASLPMPDRLEQAARVCDRLAEDVAELAAWLRRQRLTLAGKP